MELCNCGCYLCLRSRLRTARVRRRGRHQPIVDGTHLARFVGRLSAFIRALSCFGSFGYGFGAYIAARLRVPSANTSDISEFRNGVDGLLVWALATLLTGLIALAIAQAAPRLATPSGSSAQTPVVGENIIAYDLDRLFRSERRPQGVAENINYPRAEAGRILLTASSHRGMQAEDRSYLVRLVATVTGLAPPDAERRVDQVIAQAKENISRARRTGVILGFMVGAAALLGAAAAWYIASTTGRYRDRGETLHPLWDWGRPPSR